MLLFPSLLVAALTVNASAADKLPTNVAKTAKAAKAAANGKAKPSPAPPQPQPTPAQPVVPLRPSQMPSVAPRVSYQQGMLTVVAENCTIADILSAIRTATGIRIESVGGPSGDRVAAKIGPARPREVLLSLLQGSRFDYVMLGSVSDPERIERVVLSPKLGAAPAPPQALAQQQQQEPVRDTDQENDPVDLSQPDSEEAGAPPLRGEEPPPPGQEQQQQQQPQPGYPQQQPQGQPGYPQQEPGQNSTNPNPQLNQVQPNAQQQGQGQQGQQQVKTPEQLLEELRMRQQQQQQSQPQQQQEPEQQQSPEQQQEQQQQPEQQQPEQQQQQPPDDSNPQQ